MSESTGKIFQVISDVMADVESIAKNRENTQQRYRFRGIDDIYNHLHDLMGKHRLFALPSVISEWTEERKTNNGGNLIYRRMHMRYTFYTDDGSSVEMDTIGEGMDSGDKASNKAMSAAHKYGLIQLFMIPTEDLAEADSEVPHESTPASSSEKGAAINSPRTAVMEQIKTEIDSGLFSSNEVAAYRKAAMKADVDQLKELHHSIAAARRIRVLKGLMSDPASGLSEENATDRITALVEIRDLSALDEAIKYWQSIVDEKKTEEELF